MPIDDGAKGRGLAEGSAEDPPPANVGVCGSLYARDALMVLRHYTREQQMKRL